MGRRLHALIIPNIRSLLVKPTNLTTLMSNQKHHLTSVQATEIPILLTRYLRRKRERKKPLSLQQPSLTPQRRPGKAFKPSTNRREKAISQTNRLYTRRNPLTARPRCQEISLRIRSSLGNDRSARSISPQKGKWLWILQTK